MPGNSSSIPVLKRTIFLCPIKLVQKRPPRSSDYHQTRARVSSSYYTDVFKLLIE